MLGPSSLKEHSVNRDIETLRGVAILFVLFHHFGFLIIGMPAYKIFKSDFGLWSGVDLFFCISGFIISKNYYENFARAGKSSLFAVTAAFWIKRIFRLWPSAWLWLALMVWQFTVLGLAPFWNNFSDTAAAVLEVANFHWWMCANGQSQCGQISHYWSLSLEEQFYLLFPLLFLLPRQLHLWLFLGIAAIQIPIPRAPWQDILWFTRTDAISLGVCIYLLSRSQAYQQMRPIFLRNKVAAAVISVGLAVLLAAFAEPQGFPQRAIVPFATGMVAIISALFVLLASYDGDWLFNLPVLRPILLWIGARSYAIYLIQVFAYQAGQYLVSKSWAVRLVPAGWLPVATAILTFGLLGILAELNYRLLERPLRKQGAVFASRMMLRV